MQSLQKVCGHFAVAVGFVKGILQKLEVSKLGDQTFRDIKPAYATYL